jgi:hypothetical protein
MERALTPMQRAVRRFNSGRPPATPKNTPLGAVMLATEQRKRFAEILAAEKGAKHPRITSMGVVIRFPNPDPNALADFILVEEGEEGQAKALLEMYGAKSKGEFTIAGLQFGVQDGKEKRQVAFPIDRTQKGEEALLWSCLRQSSGSIQGTANN